MDLKRSFLYLILALLCFSCGDKAKPTNQLTHPAYSDPAVKGFTDDISKDPENARLYFNRGIRLHRMGEDTLALRDFKQAVTLDSSRAEYFSAVGDLMFEHQDINGSLPYLEKAVKLNPNDPTAHIKIAKLFIYLKEYKRAGDELNFVQRKNAMTAETYFLEGILKKDMGDTSAESSFLTALQVDPYYKDAAIQLGMLHSKKKNPVALRYFDNAYRMDTMDVFPLYAKGMYYQEQEKYEQAKQEYSICIAKDQYYTDAYFGMGWILMQQDSLDKARRQFDIVTKLEPTNAEAYYNRGLCSEMMGRNPEALSDYKQALVFDEKYTEARTGINRVSGKK